METYCLESKETEMDCPDMSGTGQSLQAGGRGKGGGGGVPKLFAPPLKKM